MNLASLALVGFILATLAYVVPESFRPFYGLIQLKKTATGQITKNRGAV